MRVTTFNVRGFRDGRDRVVGVVREIEPDLLLLQETGSRRALRRFAIETGMCAVRDPWSPLRRRVKNAVLVRDPWRPAPGRSVRFTRARRWYPRGALVTRVDRDGHAPVWALSTHLGLGGDERGRQADALLGLVASLGGGPVVVGGDLNATPEERVPARIRAALSDAWVDAGEGDGATFPAPAPHARIDYVFVSAALQVRAAYVGTPDSGDASDHLPVTAEVVLAQASGQ